MKTKLFALLLLIAFTVFAGNPHTINFIWDPSPSTGVAGYKLYMGGSSNTLGLTLVLGNQTNATLNGVANGTWFFAVTAYTPEGFESDFSNIVKATIPNPPGRLTATP